MNGPGPADEYQSRLLWPVVDTARLFGSRRAFERFCAEGRWRVRVNGGGGAAILDRWRKHVPVLGVRGMWAPTAQIPDFVRDAVEVARSLGLEQVVSPLVSRQLLPPYEKARMRVLEEIIAFRARSTDVRSSAIPSNLLMRPAGAADVDAIVSLDADSFSQFWRYGEHEIDEALSEARVTAVQTDERIAGYSVVTANRGIAMLARIAVHPAFRGRGIGSALVSDAARYAERVGATTVTLCTQATNAEARSLYAKAGFAEVREPYVLAVTEA